MNYLFFSDLHLGCPLFKNEKKLRSLITSFEFEKVFILGDIIDTWEDSVSRIVKKYSGLIKDINKIKDLTIIRGNHDPKINELKKIFPNATIVDFYEDDHFVMMHGHKYDDLYNRLYIFIRVVYPVVWILERFGINVKAKLRRWSSHLYRKSDKKLKDRNLDIEQKAIDGHKDKGKIILEGHTHAPKKIETDEYVFVNCGSVISNDTYAVFANGDLKLGVLDE